MLFTYAGIKALHPCLAKELSGNGCLSSLPGAALEHAWDIRIRCKPQEELQEKYTVSNKLSAAGCFRRDGRKALEEL